MTKLDDTTEKACLEEISHLVLDAGKKVTLPMLSHNHGLPFVECSNLLDQWLKSNKVHAGKVSPSYFVQYIDENGNPAVTMVSFDKLKSLKINPKYKKITEMLFGIALTTTNRTTGLEESFENIHIPIKAKFQLRNIAQRPVPPTVTEPKIHIKSEKVTNVGTKNISNMFSKQSTVKKEVVEAKKSPVKKEVETKKESPGKRKESPKKPLKSAPSSSKGNIASFFSKGQTKPTTSIKPQTSIVKSEEPQKKEEQAKPTSSIIDTDDDDDVVAGTPQEKKGVRKTSVKEKAPVKFTQSKKHSRIAVLEDSSESEEEEEDRDFKRNEQKIEIHISEPEDDPTPKEQKSEAKVKEEIKSGTSEKRRTGTRQVLRKYQDEDGFMVTRKETEVYVLSEEESEPLEKKVKAEEKPEEVKPVAKTKQKNIMSFFSKK